MAKTQFLDEDTELNRKAFPDLGDSHLSCEVMRLLQKTLSQLYLQKKTMTNIVDDEPHAFLLK